MKESWESKLGFSSLVESESHEVGEETPQFQEASFDSDQVSSISRESLDFFAALAIPTVFKYLFPSVFKAIWSWLIGYTSKVRDFSQLAIGLPRGYGKTMLIKLFVLYVIVFTKKQFILIICGTQGKANNIIADIVGMLDEPNIKKVFGDWRIGISTDRQDLKKFGFRGRNIILMGSGAQSDIRGITLENVRPDIMIFDDIQTKEDADSDVISAKLETWMIGTAMKAKSPEGCLFIFIANMYSTKHSLLRKLKSNPTWTKFIAGGILSDGTSLWEELQPLEQLLKEFENDLAMGHPEVFYAEVLNDENASVNSFIDISNIPENPFEGDSPHQGNFIIIDLATDKAKADFVSIGYFEIFDGKPVLQELIEDRLSPGASVEEALKLCLRNSCRLVAVESNAYQYSYLYWFNLICIQRGIVGINCVDIYSGSMSKNARILNMFKELLRGDQYVSAGTKLQVFSQITSFNPLKSNNTDGILDLLTYAHKTLECYGEFIVSALTLEMQEFSEIRVLQETENSPF